MKKIFIIVIMAFMAVILLTGCDSGKVDGPELDPSFNEILIKEIEITPIVIR